MSSFTKFYDGYSKIIKDMKGARRMRGGDKANVLERYPKAVCVYLDGEFDRYGVKLEEHGKVISLGRTAAQAWRRAYERLIREGLI